MHAPGRTCAVRDDDRPAQSEQRRPAVGLGFKPFGHFPERAALQHRTEPGRPVGQDRFPDLRGREADRSFQRLQGYVPGEPVGDDHVYLAGHQVAAFDVPREAQRGGPVGRIRGEQFVRVPGQLVPLAGLGPDGQQSHPRSLDAQGHLRVGHTELGELDQHLRFWIRGRAHVDEHGGPGQAGQYGRERGPHPARERPQPQPGGGDDPAGRSG